jgi:hypothetical protein
MLYINWTQTAMKSSHVISCANRELIFQCFRDYLYFQHQPLMYECYSHMYLYHRICSQFTWQHTNEGTVGWSMMVTGTCCRNKMGTQYMLLVLSHSLHCFLMALPRFVMLELNSVWNNGFYRHIDAGDDPRGLYCIQYLWKLQIIYSTQTVLCQCQKWFTEFQI